MPEPFLSIIVATFNSADTLPQALDSVFSQSFNSWELILIDGGSTDGTMEIVERHRDRIAHWESSPDRGVYDAWNKGIVRACGEWIYFLGSDDILWQNDVLERMVPHLESALEQDKRILYGKVARIKMDGQVRQILGTPWEIARRTFSQEMSIPHPGVFHHRSLFEEHGPFDADFRIVGDYEFLLRELKEHDALFVPDLIVNGMREGGMSSLAKNNERIVEELAVARKKNGIRAFSPILWSRRVRNRVRKLLEFFCGEARIEKLAERYHAWRDRR